MYSEILNTYEVIELQNNGFTKNEWFIGSALMGQDFSQLREGAYFYYQETIWTKVLELESINPYWEIYNRTDNFLLVDKGSSFEIEFLLDVLTEIKKYLAKELEYFFVTTDPFASEILKKNKYEVISEDMPFFIGEEKVGSYLKVFAHHGQRFVPVVDCTIFKWQGKRYFEINSNKFYLELLEYILYKKIPAKFLQADEIFNLGMASDFSEYIDFQENIRLVSLLDCLLKLSESHEKLTGNYRGHTTKKLLKKFAVYASVTKHEIERACSVLSPSYSDFLKKELDKMKAYYPQLMAKYSKDILRDRYGVTDLLFHHLSGDLTLTRVNHKLENVQYFTDIPFVEQALSIEQFKATIAKIIEGKKSAKYDKITK
ncbi:hypothetical protein D3H64_01640 [Atopobacter sp. AH10]|uniref:hypothetical protein n=1 Tax=Atopobacter sp. AH10 TaxID=2315861 RepID=UPI000EF220BD|nr:hypothetical protein [Atopobacter sp. AH10]RLK63980.1 hypothetical protein D3H64_01640 [Atopobacter sp. AH10]